MRLFRAPTAVPDTRPAMLSVIALMVLLLPMTLMTSSAQKLAGLSLSVSGPSETLPPEPPGPVEALRVEVTEAGSYRITAAVRSTDVRATVGDTEAKTFEAADLTALRQVLAQIKGLDPARERITLAPAPTTRTARVVTLMDAVRAGPDGPLYPSVILESPQ